MSLPFAYRIHLLSRKELQAACLFADGCSATEVYKLTGIVSQTRQRILEKLGLTSIREVQQYRAELKAKAGFIT